MRNRPPGARARIACSTHARCSSASAATEVANSKLILQTMEAFNEYLNESFPVGAKRTRSALVRQSYADRIVRYLKDGSNEYDKNFRHLVKKSGFQLLDLATRSWSKRCTSSEDQ